MKPEDAWQYSFGLVPSTLSRITCALGLQGLIRLYVCLGSLNPKPLLYGQQKSYPHIRGILIFSGFRKLQPPVLLELGFIGFRVKVSGFRVKP